MHQAQRITLLGAIGLIGGALLPWVKVTTIFGTLSKAGHEGDGLFTGAMGVVLLLGALLYPGKAGKRYSVASSLLALVAGAIALFALWNVSAAINPTSQELGIIDASVGVGLYVTLLGAFIVVVGGLQNVPASSRSSPSPSDRAPTSEM